MITYYSSSKRTRKPYTYEAHSYVAPVYQSSGITKNLFGEAMRRDRVIKKLLDEAGYKVGDIVECSIVSAREKYGDIKVEKMLDSYIKMGKDEKWPESDCPFLVTCFSEKENIRFTCTVHYLRAKTIEEIK